MTKSKFVKSSGNVFTDVGIGELEAKELQFRSMLMLKLNHYIQKNQLTQARAAKLLGVTQPRISNLMSGRVDLFSTSTLLLMMEKVGFEVFERIEHALDNAA